MSGMPTLLSNARLQLPKDDAEAQQRIQHLIDFTRNDAEFAEAEISDDMRRVRSHHAVATWAAVETTIEHTLVNHVRQVPDADKLILAHMPAVKSRSIKTSTMRGAMSTVRAWESELSQTETMERQLEMLRAFSLNISLEGDNSRALSEMAGLRDVILHNAGLIDPQFLKRCPWRSDSAGDRVAINFVTMESYFDAASDFAEKLMKAVVSSPYMEVGS